MVQERHSSRWYPPSMLYHTSKPRSFRTHPLFSSEVGDCTAGWSPQSAGPLIPPCCHHTLHVHYPITCFDIKMNLYAMFSLACRFCRPDFDSHYGLFLCPPIILGYCKGYNMLPVSFATSHSLSTLVGEGVCSPDMKSISDSIVCDSNVLRVSSLQAQL